MKAACPTDICPANPVRIFRPCMEIVIIKMVLMMLRKYLLGKSLGSNSRKSRNKPKVIH
jgi:hypothetical protein